MLFLNFRYLSWPSISTGISAVSVIRRWGFSQPIRVEASSLRPSFLLAFTGFHISFPCYAHARSHARGGRHHLRRPSRFSCRRCLRVSPDATPFPICSTMTSATWRRFRRPTSSTVNSGVRGDSRKSCSCSCKVRQCLILCQGFRSLLFFSLLFGKRLRLKHRDASLTSG